MQTHCSINLNRELCCWLARNVLAVMFISFFMFCDCLAWLLVEAVSPEPVAEVIPHQQRSAPNSHSSPPQYHQQTHQHHLQQHNYQSQPQHHQRQPDLNQMKTVSSPSRAVIAPNSDSPYSSRQSASSTLVYSSQPNALGKKKTSIINFPLSRHFIFPAFVFNRKSTSLFSCLWDFCPRSPSYRCGRNYGICLAARYQSRNTSCWSRFIYRNL